MRIYVESHLVLRRRQGPNKGFGVVGRRAIPFACFGLRIANWTYRKRPSVGKSSFLLKRYALQSRRFFLLFLQVSSFWSAQGPKALLLHKFLPRGLLFDIGPTQARWAEDSSPIMWYLKNAKYSFPSIYILFRVHIKKKNLKCYQNFIWIRSAR